MVIGYAKEFSVKSYKPIFQPLTNLKRQNEKAGLDILACNEFTTEPSTGNIALDVYKEHLERRQIIITGVIDESVVDKVTLQIMRFNEIDDEREEDKNYDRLENPIILKIVSPGGYTTFGMTIVSQIVQSNTPVIGVAIGDVSSMATLILAVCHARFSSIYSRIMVHSLSSGSQGKFKDLIEDMEEYTKIQKVLDGILTSRTLISQKTLDDLHEKKKDWYLSSKEAYDVGLIDEIIEPGLKIGAIKARRKAADKIAAAKSCKTCK